MSRTRWLAVVVFSAILALGVAACGSDDTSGSGGGSSSDGGGESAEVSGEIAGAGASSQEAAQEAWRAEFESANGGATISYDPVGSGGGREQFIAGGVSFAGSDAALTEEEGELKKAISRCEPGELIEIPAYVSPIAVIYNLPEVEELQLDPETVAKIFNQEITAWNDAAIAKTNPDVELPDTRITPVNRSDESGTTENFTEYLSEVVPSAWPHEVSGDWPVKGGEAAQGTSGVVEAVSVGDGAIGYADASQAGELGVATIEVGEEFVAPSPEAAAAILDESPEDKADAPGKYMFPFKLDRRTEAEGTYPIVLVSYLLACTKYGSADEAALTKAYLEYVISPEGQEAAAANAGSAPLSPALTAKITPAIEAIEG
ncbi:MAG TPA: phosphate ABC transporter substrate-binding protein PstS [Solirubrobacterales bacterium]|nr:phosphate ABC transporter substrate-binding protein PstS [Solirubrobacterales bacterium]